MVTGESDPCIDIENAIHGTISNILTHEFPASFRREGLYEIITEFKKGEGLPYLRWDKREYGERGTKDYGTQHEERLKGLMTSAYTISFGDAIKTLAPYLRQVDAAMSEQPNDNSNTRASSTFDHVRGELLKRSTIKSSMWDVMDCFDEDGTITAEGEALAAEYPADYPFEDMLAEDDIRRIFSEPITRAYLRTAEGKALIEAKQNPKPVAEAESAMR